MAFMPALLLVTSVSGYAFRRELCIHGWMDGWMLYFAGYFCIKLYHDRKALGANMTA